MPSAYTSTLKLVKESLPLITALGMIVGSSVIALYAVRIGFFPSGITAGDTIVLLSIFVAVAISCTFLTFAIYTQIVLASQLIRPAFNYISNRFTRPNSVFIPVKTSTEDLQVALIGAFIAAWTFFGVLLPNGQLLAGEGIQDLLLIILALSILYVAIRSRKANVTDPRLLNSNIRFAEVGLWLMMWLLPATIIIFSTSAHDLLLSVLKIRLSNISVVIEGNGRESLWNAIDVKNCKQDQHTITCNNVNVPLYGIGNQVFVRLPSKEQGKTIVFAISKDKVILFH